MSLKNRQPQRKRYKLQSRLIVAADWIKTYNGKNLIKGYSKYFGVDKLCAIKELEILGVVISEERKKQIIEANKRIIEERKKRKEGKEKADTDFADSDDEFSFIAGYTSSGAAYGVGKDEQVNDDFNLDEQESDIVKRILEQNNELPW